MCDQDIRQGIQALQEWTIRHETRFNDHEQAELTNRIDTQAAIVENTQVMKSHIQDNQEVRDSMEEILLVAKFVKDMEGFVSVLNRIKSFFKWILGFAVISSSIAFITRYWPLH